MKKSFMSLSDGILGSLGKTFLITFAIVNLIAYFRPVASMIARFFKTTGDLFSGKIGIFDYIGQNFTVWLSAGLYAAKGAIWTYLFGPKGFFGLLGKYLSTLGKLIGKGKGWMALRVLGQILKRFIIIPLMIFAAIKGFFTDFETAMEQGDGVALAIVKGLWGAFKGALQMGFDLVISPVISVIEFFVGLLVDFIKYVASFIPKSISDTVSNFMGTDRTTEQREAENRAAGDAINKWLFGDYKNKNKKTDIATITPNGAGGGTNVTTIVNTTSQSTRNDNTYADISTVDAGGTATGLG